MASREVIRRVTRGSYSGRGIHETLLDRVVGAAVDISWMPPSERAAVAVDGKRQAAEVYHDTRVNDDGLA